MNKLLIGSLLFLGISAGVWVLRPNDPAQASGAAIVDAYELQVQRGVAERLLILNQLARAEGISQYNWHTAKLRALKEELDLGNDTLRSMASGRIMFEFFDLVGQGKARLAAVERAQKRRVQESQAIMAAWQDVLNWDFHRHVALPL